MKTKKIDIMLKVILSICIAIFSSNAVNAASVIYFPSSNEIVIYSTEITNFSSLYTALDNESLLSHSGSIWYLNATIRLDNGAPFYINNSDVSELRMSNYKNGLGLYRGDFYIENVTVGSWNYSQNKYASRGEPQVGFEIDGGILRNTRFQGLSGILYYNRTLDDIYNVTMQNGNGKALVLIGFYTQKIHDIDIMNFEGGGLYLESCNNTEAYNIYVDNVGDYTNPSTGNNGIVVQRSWTNSKSTDVIVHDVYVNRTGWSAIDEGGVYNVTFYNLTIHNAGHNGLDLHGGAGHKVENVTIYDSVSNNLYITAKDCYLKNVTVFNPIEDQINVCNDGWSDNITFENLTMIAGNRGLVLFDSSNVTTRNMTSNGTALPLLLTSVLSPIRDYKSIDSYLSSNCWIESATRPIFINTYFPSMQFSSEPGNDYTTYYYLDIFVKNEKGTQIPNAKIVVRNDINSSCQSINGYGDNQTIFYTASNGYIPVPSQNRSNSPAIAEYYRNSSGIQNFTHSANITTQEKRTVSISGITPDSSWYRNDPNIPTYTITAIIPDNSRGPHIIGFTPSEDNPFNPGENKNFRVWVDGSLTDMKWTVYDETNGKNETVAKGMLNYTWNVSKSVSKIEFFGMSSNGNVSQVWDVGNHNDNLLRYNVYKDHVADPQDTNIIAQIWDYCKETLSGLIQL